MRWYPAFYMRYGIGGDCCAQSALSPCVCFGQHKGQLRCGGALAIHISGCLPDAHRAALFHQLTMERKNIPWGDLFAEAGIFDAAEEGQFAFAFGDAQRRHGSGLGQCFQDQHPWHDRLAREVTAEEFFVAGYALAANGPLPRLVVQDAVHESKGVAVGRRAAICSLFRAFAFSRTVRGSAMAQPSHLRRAMQALCPPKPRLLLSA